MVAGTRVPQITAIMQVHKALKGKKTKIISDGGIKFSGDIAKATSNRRRRNYDGSICWNR